MNDISSVLSALAFFLSIAAVFFAARSATQQQELREALSRLPLSRLKSLETSLADTQGALEEVANRVKMMRVRNAANHVSEPTDHNRGSRGEPDPHKEPDRWRDWANSQLARKRAGI